MWKLRGRTDLERFDTFTQGSLYFLSGMEMVLALQAVAHIDAETPGNVMIGIMAVAAMHTAACLVLLHGSLRHRMDGGPRPDKQRIAAASVTVGAVAAVLAWREYLPWASDGMPDVGFISAAGVVFFFLAPLTAGLSARGATRVLGAGVVTAFAIGLPATSSSGSIGVGSLVGVMTALAASYRLSVWMLDVVVRLDRARTTEAALAVAEERLRFARDLHDTLGRNLSVVALKSELAEALVTRDPDRATGEIRGVRQLAEDSLAEVRAVVRGHRVACLDSELSGSRSLLSAAGTECEMSGSGDELPEHVQSTLGWVVREATTNVLRHAEASSCRIDVQVDDGVARLSMRNDGVREQQSVQTGSGLAGLRERLEAQGGTLTAGPDGNDHFVLTATVPVEPRRTMADA
ncbi:MAG TPA: histidine kinase [Jiangellaceae bacterium]